MNIDEIVKAKFPSEQLKALVNVRITSNHIYAIQNNFMKDFGLSMAQFNILRILRGANEPLTINTIKKRMIEKSPNSTRLIDKLLEKNMVERFGCKEDRRQSYIQLAQEGRLILAQIDVSKFSTFLTSDKFSDEDARLLNDLLDKLRNVY